MRSLGLEKLASPRFFFFGGGGPFWIENTSNDFLAVFYGRFFSWEPFWNTNTWNDFLARFRITCCQSGIVRMVVYAIPRIQLLEAE